MKKFSILFLAAFGLSNYSFANTTAQVDFIGSILANSCEIVTKHQVVNMGNISKLVLENSQHSEKVPFSIELDNCDLEQNVTLKLTAEAYEDQLRVINTVGTAQNVGLVLFEDDGEIPLIIDDNLSNKVATTNGEKIIYNLSAAYVPMNSTIVAGTADATATFSIVYP